MNIINFKLKETLAIFAGVIILCTMQIFLGKLHDGKKNESFKKIITVPVIQNEKVQPITIQAQKNILQHTDFVGTFDQPTIDGGIINAADGLPVQYSKINQSIKDNNISKKTIKKYSNNKLGASSEKINVNKKNSFGKAFQDNWATSKQVKLLLKEAVQEGKLGYVLSKLDESNLPASVAVVPMVESRYNNYLTSKKGAGGAWQIMPGTARDYGLSKNDRYDFGQSTETALRLIIDLHKQFGNWELAFAAYNAGSARVKQALRHNPNAKTIDELDLPQETKQYVKRIKNINQIMMKY